MSIQTCCPLGNGWKVRRLISSCGLVVFVVVQKERERETMKEKERKKKSWTPAKDRERKACLADRTQAKGRGRQPGAAEEAAVWIFNQTLRTLASTCSTQTRPPRRKLNMKITETPGKTSQPNLLFGFPAAVLTGARLLLVTITWLETALQWADREDWEPTAKEHRGPRPSGESQGCAFSEGGWLWNLWQYD